MSKGRLIDQVARLMAELQDAVQLLDESAADRLGINLTDLRCMRQIVQRGPQSPSQLADATGLTRAAISAALDRLESADIARRVPDPSDRRRALVEPTPTAQVAIAEIWSPLEKDGRRELASYTPGQLEVIIDFMQKSTQVHDKHSSRLQEANAQSS